LNSKGFSLLETVIFIVLAAVVIPIFYLTTQPVIKDMMTPTSWIKARFAAEKKMEQFMAYSFADSTLTVGNFGPSAVTADTAFPATDYAGYQWQWAINYLDCDNPSIPTGTPGRCVGYLGTALITVPNPPAYTTNYKQIDVTVQGAQGVSYRATSAVTARW
jgi:hypothetical protein